MHTVRHIAACVIASALIALAAAPCRAEEGLPPGAEPAAAPELPAADAGEQAPELLLFQDIPVVVTASRMEERVTDAPASVTVITREQILNSGAISIPDILRMAPGVEVMQTTGGGWEVGIRGLVQLLAREVLVLLDGRTVYKDFNADVNWYALPVVLEDIERIEIIRGPLSSLWGANALSGVINIITRPAAESQGTLATAQWGSRGTLRGTVVHGGEAAGGRVRYKLSAAREEVGQWTPFRPEALTSLTADRKAGEVTKANLALEWQSRDRARWSLFAGTCAGDRLGVIPVSDIQSLWEQDDAYLSLAYERDHLTLRAYWNGARLAHTEPPSWTAATIYTDLYDLEALKSTTLGQHELIYGASYRQTQVGQGGLAFMDGPHHERLWAGYVEDSYRASESTRLVLAARYDHHPLAGGAVSGRATVMRSLSPNRTLRLSAANAFRSPSFFESYLLHITPASPPLPEVPVSGSTDLESEGIVAYDLEYRVQASPATSAGVCLYHHRLDNLISLQPLPGATLQYRQSNAGSVSATGLEAEISHQLSATRSVFANYSYQSPSASNEAATAFIALSPRHKANVGLNWSALERGLTGSLLLNYVDKAIGGVTGPALLVNGYVGWRRPGGPEIGLCFFNLANCRHQEYGQGDIIGRRIMGSVRWEF
jgi:iron complex outermembrane receptor protein